MNKFIKNIFLAFIGFSLIFLLVVLTILWNFSNKIPDYTFLKNYKPPVSSKVYSGNAELVADFSQEKRIFIPYNSIPKTVINSFLSAEDKNFFSHPGVDAKGVIRAVFNNIQNLLKGIPEDIREEINEILNNLKDNEDSVEKKKIIEKMIAISTIKNSLNQSNEESITDNETIQTIISNAISNVEDENNDDDDDDDDDMPELESVDSGEEMEEVN